MFPIVCYEYSMRLLNVYDLVVWDFIAFSENTVFQHSELLFVDPDGSLS